MAHTQLAGDVLLIIAHPDDETMFFSPLLTRISSSIGSRAHVLCLSTGVAGSRRPHASKTRHDLTHVVLAPCSYTAGGAYGQGGVRGVELQSAARVLGVPPSCVSCVDDPKLQVCGDEELRHVALRNVACCRQQWCSCMHAHAGWHACALGAGGNHSAHPCRCATMGHQTGMARFTAPSCKLLRDAFDHTSGWIKVLLQIVTFDDKGVSGHLNHICTHHGVRWGESVLCALRVSIASALLVQRASACSSQAVTSVLPQIIHGVAGQGGRAAPFTCLATDHTWADHQVLWDSGCVPDMGSGSAAAPQEHQRQLQAAAGG
jgi:LmbE family N-acetylglucosaminyl deacetylase